MNKINCLIVDDEPPALDILEDFIHKIPFLHLINKCENSMDALDILKNQNIDLLFLDIQMPDISGIQLLKSLPQKPPVILTTAYKEYAIEGFDLDVVDYLLKPIGFERFLKAVNKAGEFLQSKDIAANSTEKEFLFVKADYKLVKIRFEDIIYIESVKDYIKIKTGDKVILTLMRISAIEEKLPSSRFIRVHRSFIVSLNNINTIARHRIVIGDKYIPITSPYREKFYEMIRKFT